MSSTYEQTIELPDLPTKSVTFYPTKAEIVRDITNVKLSPGINTIAIVGLTPITDASSVKLEASGVSLTDMVVELINNPDTYEDVYPSDDETSSEEESESDDEPSDEIKALQKQIDDLTLEALAYQETISSNDRSLEMLEDMMSRFEMKESITLERNVEVYHRQRPKVWKAKAAAEQEKSKVDEKIQKLIKKKLKLELKKTEADLKALRKKEKEKAKQKRALDKQQSQSKLIKADRATFWPKKVYQVKATIEINIQTPGTSRRSSIGSLATANTIKPGDTNTEPMTTNFLLTYIVNGASWCPKYDLNISSVTTTGTMIYKAEISNTTSETWRDAKVILSTSRATFAGVSEPIPIIRPWPLQLEKLHGPPNHALQPVSSKQEKDNTVDLRRKVNADTYINRNGLFGASPKRSTRGSTDLEAVKSGGADVCRQDYQMQLMLIEQQNQKRLLMARQEQDRSASKPVFGGAPQSNMMQQYQTSAAFAPTGAVPPPPPAPALASASAPGGLGGSQGMRMRASAPETRMKMSKRRAGGEQEKKESTDEDEEMGFGLFDDAEPPSDPSEPSWDEQGLTSSFELPGTRTIAPSSSDRVFKIATIKLNQMTLTHVVVPKLKPEAFLRARIINSSPTALLKGSAGLTLDGTFLGHTSIPRCSAGENFPLPLGVDPAITISYPAPISKRNMGTGVFNKEQSTTFSRTIILTNTRSAGGAVNMTVRDQIPISEDERLKIDINIPRGLNEEGDKAKAGVEFQSAQTQKITSSSGASSSSSSGAATSASGSKAVASASSTPTGPWGSAIAQWKKFSVIEYAVTLNPGKSVKLTLEYTLRWPATEKPVEPYRAPGAYGEEQ